MRLSVLCLAYCLFSAVAHAQDGDITLAAGAFDYRHTGSAMLQVEYRPGMDWSGFRPQLGAFATSDSAAYLYAGIGYPLSITDRWTLQPSISAGFYHDGADIDLGYDLEFYSQLRLAYRLSDTTQLGLGIAHISNASLGDHNPGAQLAYLSFSFAY